MRKYFYLFFLFFTSSAFAANFSAGEKVDTTGKTKLYVDKISASLNFTMGAPIENYSPIGFTVRANYKVWRNFSAGIYNAFTFSRDVQNMNSHLVYYVSTDTYIHTMGTLGYQYYIFDKKLAFGLYALGGTYHRRIKSHIEEKTNNINRDYKVKHTDFCKGIMYDMHFAINKRLAINADVSLFSNPYWGVDVYGGVGLIYNYGTRSYSPLRKRK